MRNKSLEDTFINKRTDGCLWCGTFCVEVDYV